MRFFRPWFIIRWLYPDALFRIKTNYKTCCLTFDDGPNPESTPTILDLLDRYKVKVMFFCTGKAAEEYPQLIDAIRKRGHLIGNHGYNHPEGWKTSLQNYLDDINLASGLTSDKYFRPPYGHLTINQYRHLRRSYKIIFWDIMPYDFDNKLDPSQSFEILKGKLRPGSVIVLHDMPGSSAEITLRFLEYSISNGYRFVFPD